MNKISDDKALLNLYIRYMRDYQNDDDFKNIAAVREDSKLKISIFPEPIQFKEEDTKKESGHKFLGQQYNKLYNSYQEEQDGRKKKSIKKELEKLQPFKDRYDLIIKAQKKPLKSSSFLSGIIEIFDDRPKIDTNPEAYNHLYDDCIESDGFIELNKLVISIKDIKDFSYQYSLIACLFGLNENTKTIENSLLHIIPITLEENTIPQYYEEQIDKWIKSSKQVDDAIKYLISSGYINQSRNKIIDKVDNGF